MPNQKKQEQEKKISSKELFGDAKVVLIEHEASVYRLLLTRQGKLILNK